MILSNSNPVPLRELNVCLRSSNLFMLYSRTTFRNSFAFPASSSMPLDSQRKQRTSTLHAETVVMCKASRSILALLALLSQEPVMRKPPKLCDETNISVPRMITMIQSVLSILTWLCTINVPLLISKHSNYKSFRIWFPSVNCPDTLSWRLIGMYSLWDLKHG